MDVRVIQSCTAPPVSQNELKSSSSKTARVDLDAKVEGVNETKCSSQDTLSISSRHWLLNKMKCDHCIESYFVYDFSVIVTVGFVMNVLTFFYYICIFQELLGCVVQEAALQFYIVLMYTLGNYQLYQTSALPSRSLQKCVPCLILSLCVFICLNPAPCNYL